jgi:hypothetical protein
VSVVTVGLVVHALPAAAKPAPVSLGLGDIVVSDGVRYAAVPTGAGRVRVFDDAHQTSFDLEQPSGCAGDGQYPSGGVGAVGGGVLVWNCEVPQQGGWYRPRLVSLATRAPVAAATAAVENPPESAGGVNFGTSAIGSQWLTGTIFGYHWYRTIFVNWHTGATVYDQPASADTYADLNSPRLTGELCSPLRQPRNPYYDPTATETTPRYLPIEYRRPWAVWRSRRGLTLARCGQRGRALLVSDCQGSNVNQNFLCVTPEVSAGLVTWSLGNVVHAYVIATRRRYAWRVPNDSPDHPPIVTHTRNAIYVTVGTYLGGGRYVIRGTF